LVCAEEFPTDQRFLGELVTLTIGVEAAADELGQLVGDDGSVGAATPHRRFSVVAAASSRKRRPSS
jgi:hypothetical protein